MFHYSSDLTVVIVTVIKITVVTVAIMRVLTVVIVTGVKVTVMIIVIVTVVTVLVVTVVIVTVALLTVVIVTHYSKNKNKKLDTLTTNEMFSGQRLEILEMFFLATVLLTRSVTRNYSVSHLVA